MIKVLFFAIARERAGCASVELDITDLKTLGQCTDRIMTLYPSLNPLRPYLRFALNETFCGDMETPVRSGDVIALIPPVSGGNSLPLLTDSPIDRDRIEALVVGEDSGALVSFVGRVRNHTAEHEVTHLDYEAYTPMAKKTLQTILEDVQTTFPGVRIALQHRLGRLEIGDVAVFIAVASPHRAAAFSACQTLIDRLKADVPIFKKESRGDGSVWIGLGP